MLNNRVHPGNFKVLIMPGHKTISWSSLKRIQAFFDAGGTVIATGRLPSKSAEFGHNGDVQRAVRRMFENTVGSGPTNELFQLKRNRRGGCALRLQSLNAQTLREALDAVAPAEDVHFESQQVLRCIHKRSNRGDIYYLANLDPGTPADCSVLLQGQQELEAWDPHTGRIEAVTYSHATLKATLYTRVQITLPYLRSVFLVTTSTGD